MNVRRGTTLFAVALFVLLNAPGMATAQGSDQNGHFGATVSTSDATSLQQKAANAQARIQTHKGDRDQLMIAVKTNEVSLAKQVLLRNGFTAEDLANAKITLRTGGGKGTKDELEISATRGHPNEIVIQRSLGYFTK